MKKLFLLSVISLTLSAPSLAIAQGTHSYTPYGSGYENEALLVYKAQQEAASRKNGFIKPNKIFVSVVNYDYFEPDQFGILLKLQDVEMGCFENSPLQYEANFIGGIYMDINVSHYKRTEIKTDNPGVDCPQNLQVVSGLIILNKNDLKNKGVREIRFSNGSAIDKYRIEFKEDRVELIPDTTSVFKPEELKGSNLDRIIHYDKMDGIVTLHVPMAGKEDIKTEILELAAKKGLTPIDIAVEERYEPRKNVFYFKDNSGSTIRSLENEEFAEIGSVSVSRPIEGAIGITETTKQLRVFATKPGKTL